MAILGTQGVWIAVCQPNRGIIDMAHIVISYGLLIQFLPIKSEHFCRSALSAFR